MSFPDQVFCFFFRCVFCELSENHQQSFSGIKSLFFSTWWGWSLIVRAMRCFFSSPCPIKTCPCIFSLQEQVTKSNAAVSGVTHQFICASPESYLFTKQPFALSLSLSLFVFFNCHFFVSVSGSVSPMFVRLPCGGVGVSHFFLIFLIRLFCS